MNLLKKNIIFIIVCAMTVIASAYLIYLDFAKQSEVMTANAEAQKSSEESADAYKKGNKPVEQNVEMIHSDTEKLKQKTNALQRVFGKPYRNAMIAFAAAVKSSEDELYTKFSALFNDEKEKVKTADVLIPKLLEILEKEKNISKNDMENAFKKFIADLQLETVEDLTYHTGYSLLASALGLQRTMSASMAHVYLTQIQKKINDQRLIPGVTKLSTVQDYTFNQFVQTFPSGDAILDILYTMPIYEDIFSRMKKARLAQVDSFSRISVIKLSDKYTVYSFKARIYGPLNSVRTFVNSLQDAYKDNRVYVITWISITSRSTDEVERTRSRIFGTGSASQDQREMDPGMGRPPNRLQPVSRARAQRSELEIEMQPDYGSTVIGIDNNVTAEIEFKYYVYTGDWLKNKTNG